jgi:hypothetical protein
VRSAYLLGRDSSPAPAQRPPVGGRRTVAIVPIALGGRKRNGRSPSGMISTTAPGGDPRALTSGEGERSRPERVSQDIAARHRRPWPRRGCLPDDWGHCRAGCNAAGPRRPGASVMRHGDAWCRPRGFKQAVFEVSLPRESRCAPGSNRQYT